MAYPSVVVLGGGIGGLVAARRLRDHMGGRARVTVVERDLSYRFAPSFLWLMAGTRRPERITRDLGRLRRHGIEVLQADILEVDTGDRIVKTSREAIPYDRLVVALGAELVPEAMPGFAHTAHNVYTAEGALAAGRALRRLEEGRVVVLVSSLPYKCPAAPYETALLSEALLRRRGVRGRVSIELYTPEPFPMPTAGPAVGEAISGMLAARGVALHTKQPVEAIDPDAGELVLPGGDRVGFDLLLGIPPHRAPEAASRSGLVEDGGFIPVDRSTLSTAVEGVFAIGDVTVIPIAGGKFLPKAGVFAHAEAEVVARRIADELRGRAPAAMFDGRGNCFLEMGDGVAAFATGDFYAEEGPAVRLRRPGRRWHVAKVAFERYWLRRWF